MASAPHVLFAICFVGLIFLAGGADDVDVQALQILVQQQASTITNVNAKLTALQNEVATFRNLSTDIMELKARVSTLSKAGYQVLDAIFLPCPTYRNEISEVNSMRFPHNNSFMPPANHLKL